MKYLVDNVFAERLQVELDKRANEGWRLVCYAYHPGAMQTLTVSYVQDGEWPPRQWECGCGTMNHETFTICTLCHRARREVTA